MKVRDKVIAVTGAGSGMGRALTLALLDRGAYVAAIDINPDSLAKTRSLAGEYKDRISLHTVDVTDLKAVESLADAILEAQGVIDGLINNAGIIQPFISVEELDYQTIDKVLNINLYGQIYMTKSFLPYLKARETAHIVNISSMGGFFPFHRQTLYGASKGAVKMFSEGLFLDLHDSGIKVTVVFPGAIDTNITRNSKVDLDMDSARERIPFKPLLPKKAAQKIIQGMEHDKYQVFVGVDSKAMNALYRINPIWAVKLMNQIMNKVIPV